MQGNLSEWHVPPFDLTDQITTYLDSIYCWKRHSLELK